MYDVQAAEHCRNQPSLYGVLLECAHQGAERLPHRAAATIWREIDGLRSTGESGREEIRILEEVSVQVHMLKQILTRDDRAQEALAAKVRIAGLTRQWTEVARLSG